MPMVVNTVLRETKNKGIGLFTVNQINKGEIVYVDDLMFDKLISLNEYAKMPDVQKKFIEVYASFNKLNETFYLCCDNARFFNHSDKPNTRYKENKCIAIDYIPANTELTGDYREFCDYCRDGDFGFEIAA